YTIDGYTPRETDMEYTMPMTYNVPLDQYRDLETIVITPSGKRSQVTHAVMYNKTPLAPVNFSGMASGLKYQLYSGEFTGIGQLKDAPVLDTGVVKSFNTAPFKKNMHGFGIIYSGFIRIDTEGSYGFSTSSANGSTLLIDDLTVVDNDGKHGVFDQGGTVPLQKGYHKITIKYFDTGNAGTLKVFMTIPGKPKGELSPDMLYN
ncbi:MAG: PA14 domain-containing protein, partial [Bacteroidota bacterium]|nr:PA14 domain-containing protein [Bacteroidota bacterium]